MPKKQKQIKCLGIHNRPFAPKKMNSFWVQPICAKIKKVCFSDSPFAPTLPA